jgi:altronate dehydratase
MKSEEKIQKQYEDLKNLLMSIEVDLLKNLTKGNKAAGLRARKALREVKKEAAQLIKAMIAAEKQE